MARFEFKMPDVGEGLAEVEVVQWFVQVGEAVQENQPIVEVETDKTIVTMPAPATGRVIEVAAQVGERVKVGTFLLAIETVGDPELPTPGGEEVVLSERTASPQSLIANYQLPILASPLARKIARDLGVNLKEVAGSGPRGRISEDDVRRHAEKRPAVQISPPQPDLTGLTPGDERIPVRGVRRRIAETMAESVRTIPQVVGFHEFDAAELVKERAYWQRYAEAAGVRLTYLPFIIKAVVEALKKHPYLNASYVDGPEPVILLKKSYNIGIATTTADGLVVPVLHAADQFDLLELARRAEQLISAARERRTTPKDMQDGTFTITNVGPAGGWFGTSIIRPPEAALIGLGKIEDKAVVRDGQIVARPILPLSLTFDHRIIDGAEALAFVQTLRQYLEVDPRSLSMK